MLQVDYLIIGGGIAGTTCAETLRSKDANSTIAILESENYPLYSKVLIPSYLKGKVPREKLFLRNTSHYQSQNLDFYPQTIVAAVDPQQKEVLTQDNKKFTYQKLLVATGGVPRKFSDVFSSTAPIEPLMMRDLSDADGIKTALENASEKKALVVGEGFIALEFLETLYIHGFEVHMLARGRYWGGESRFGAEGSRILEENFIRHKAIIHRDAEIAFIKNDEFYLKNGEHLKAPIWAAGIGLYRDFSFLPGVETNIGILTDEYLKTSHPDIFAAGDAAEYYDTLFGRKISVGNWTNAFLQGRCAATNMLASLEAGRSGFSADGKLQPFKAIPTYNLVNLGMSITFLGIVDCKTADGIFELTDEDRLMRVFLEGDRAIGAVLINRFNDKIMLSKLIENGYGREELEKTFKPAFAGQ